MGTKSTTSSQNTYNPAGLSAYNSLTPAFSNVTQGFINNPYGNQQFQTNQQIGQQQANNLNQTNTNQLQQNLTAQGLASGAPSAAGAQLQQDQNRANTNTSANLGFLAPVAQANANQQTALSNAANYKPLQTGGTQTQTTGGLGTWLPQLAGAGLGLATGGLFGGGGGGLSQGGFAGLGTVAPGNSSGFYSGASASPSSPGAFGGGYAGIQAPNLGSGVTAPPGISW